MGALKEGGRGLGPFWDFFRAPILMTVRPRQPLADRGLFRLQVFTRVFGGA